MNHRDSRIEREEGGERPENGEWRKEEERRKEGRGNFIVNALGGGGDFERQLITHTDRSGANRILTRKNNPTQKQEISAKKICQLPLGRR